MAHAGALRCIHAGSVGVDAVLVDEVVRGDIVVTDTRGVFERPIAECVLAVILRFAKDRHGTLARQRERRWHHRESELISDRRVVALGAGGVARELVPRLRAAGLRVDVVGRTARDGDGGLGRVHGGDAADELLAAADYAVLALPLTAETRGYFDARRLSLPSATARVINIGREPLIDEDARLEALENRRSRAPR